VLERVPSDSRKPVAELAAGLFTADRAVDRADRLVHSVDRRGLERRRRDERQMAVDSDRAQARWTVLEAQCAGVDRVVDRRATVLDLAAEAEEWRSGALDHLAARTLSDRVTVAIERLDAAVDETAAQLDPLCLRLRRTRFRRVYRMGPTWAVRYFDELGAEHVRRFPTASEARQFRDGMEIAHDAKQDHRGGYLWH
jgi:hypothetical protein